MNVYTLASKNLLRNKFRTVMTILAVAVAILAFTMLRTVISAWTAGAEHAAQDRIATRHKVTFVMSLPKRYIDKIRNTPGVQAATYANWFGAKDPKHEKEFFGNFAVDTDTYFQVYDEMEVPPDQLESWKNDRQGAVIGDSLARNFGWKVGDKITLLGSIFPGEWQFNIRGIYNAKRPSVDRTSLIFHWKYLNESIPEVRRDEIGWVVSRIQNAKDSPAISKAIDNQFENQDTQTVTMSERQMQTGFLGMFSAVLTAIDYVSLVIMAIMMLIIANTIAMGVRERTNEYGVLRAIGFLPRHVFTFIVTEAFFVGTLGGVLGLAISYPLIEKGMGKWLEENMGAWFPFFRIDPKTAIAALLLAGGLGFAAAVAPAYRAARITVADALREVG